MADSRLHQLSALGQSVWIDYLSRDLLHSGELAQMMEEDAVTGVTSNPTIFQKAIAAGRRLRRPDARPARARGGPEGDLHRARRPRHRRGVRPDAQASGTSGKGLRGYVSMEVDPTLADDTEGTIAEAKRLARARRQAEPLREDPGDEAGPAGDRGDDRGRQVDQRHADLLARAAPRGDGGVHPRHRAAGRGRRRPDGRSRRSRASSSRASTPRPTSGSTRSVATTSCRASSRSRTRSSPTRAGRRSSPASAGTALEAKGASKQWCLWASTSTKNPAYRDVHLRRGADRPATP